MLWRPSPALPLFVPAHHPDRFVVACAVRADAVVIDLEDMVAPERKAAVRRIPHGAVAAGGVRGLYLRINAVGTRWQRDNMAFARLQGFAAVVLSKTEDPAHLAVLRNALGPETVLIAMIETLRGVDAVDAIAGTSDRIALGSIDYSEHTGCAPTRMALVSVRARIVEAARRADAAARLDGITLADEPAARVVGDAAHACEMGFGGKLLIDAAQTEPARAGFRPSGDELDWATRIVAEHGSGAVLSRARRILNREGAYRATP